MVDTEPKPEPTVPFGSGAPSQPIQAPPPSPAGDTEQNLSRAPYGETDEASDGTADRPPRLDRSRTAP